MMDLVISENSYLLLLASLIGLIFYDIIALQDQSNRLITESLNLRERPF
jgi:hypothetical protein